MTTKKTLSDKELEKLVLDFQRANVKPKDLYGFTDKEMEAIYTAAYNFFKSGKYENAKDLFTSLTLFNYEEQKYWMGLAATFHMLKNYDKAIEAYAFATFLNPMDPKPAFHACDCLIKKGDKANAIKALEAAITICDISKSNNDIKKQAQALLEGVKKGMSNKTESKKSSAKQK